jgi:glycerophosphoryl diester phosphodiesterase
MARTLLLPLALFLGLAIPASASAANPWLAADRSMLNIAHQGGEDEAPSNTMFSYTRALALGADMLEMDVNITKDGQVVVMHDTHLARMCAPDVQVNQLTLAELKTYDPARRA